MSNLPSWIKITARYRTLEPLPEIPEVNGFGYFDHNRGRPDGSDGYLHELRVRINELDFQIVFDALKENSVPVVSCLLDVTFSDDFWTDVPDDCIGAILQPDGYVSLPNSVDRKSISPLSEPFYTDGRPDNDVGIGRSKPYLIHRGGIPIVSDAFLAELKDLGAEGKSAEMIYRGNNQKAYDTVQQGYKRFLIEPEYHLEPLEIDILPAGVPDDFEICSLLRSKHGFSNYEIALSLEKLEELKEQRNNLLIEPIFKHEGKLHRWLQELNKNVQN